MSERLSEEWREYRLTELAQYYNGTAFQPSDWSKEGVPIIRIEQLNNPDRPYDRFNGICRDTNLVDTGDLIFSWSATLKVVRWNHGKAVLNQHLFKVVPYQGFYKDYIYFLLDYSMPKLGSGSHGSTMKHIKRAELEKFVVRVPRFSEQRHIAEILLTLDRIKEQTETLITKMQNIKAGLMQDLMTRGIMQNGQLRPLREEAPQLYKQLPLGWIPTEWEQSTLGECMLGSPQNGLYKSIANYGEAGTPIVRIDSFYEGRLSDIDKLKRLDLTESELTSYGLNTGDILINRVNSIGFVGKSALVRDIPEPMVFESNIMRCRVDRDRATPEFLIRWLCTSQATSNLRAMAKNAIAQASINQVDVSSLDIPLPAIEEQTQISEKLCKIDAILDGEIARKDKLLRLKSGLMRDLLTGRVRVPEAMLKKAYAAV